LSSFDCGYADHTAFGNTYQDSATIPSTAHVQIAASIKLMLSADETAELVVECQRGYTFGQEKFNDQKRRRRRVCVKIRSVVAVFSLILANGQLLNWDLNNWHSINQVNAQETRTLMMLILGSLVIACLSVTAVTIIKKQHHCHRLAELIAWTVCLAWCSTSFASLLVVDNHEQTMQNRIVRSALGTVIRLETAYSHAHHNQPTADLNALVSCSDTTKTQLDSPTIGITFQPSFTSTLRVTVRYQSNLNNNQTATGKISFDPAVQMANQR
jgi:hypothetical protein